MSAAANPTPWKDSEAKGLLMEACSIANNLISCLSTRCRYRWRLAAGGWRLVAAAVKAAALLLVGLLCRIANFADPGLRTRSTVTNKVQYGINSLLVSNGKTFS
jgi:hypothetical protein